MSASDSKKAKRRRGPRKATPRYLRNAALAHLDRYAASSGHLRRLLLARVARSARLHGTDPGEGAAVVEALIVEFERAGLLDDGAYAEARARSLLRRGASARAIRAELGAKRVAPEQVRRALEGLAEVAADPELAAALAFARRRRLGPYRAAEERTPRRERDLAALARKGFDLDVTRRVVDAEDIAELEREVEGGGDL